MPDELYLIDGNSLAYRAFFALPESIATSKGQPTNAIFGFASMLVKMLTEHGQKPTVVCWDAGSSGRKEVYAEYKAQRSKRPDLLREQWPHLEPLVDAFGYRNVSVEGYEADDVIATIAERSRAQCVPVIIVTGDRDAFQLIDPDSQIRVMATARGITETKLYEADDVIATLAERSRAQGVPVVIVTGDRDAFQLIDPDSQIRVMATARGITETKLYDHQAVIDRYGIAPELIPDFYGLKGDTSDNIPGVPGIGDKTAAQLLQQFGTLEAVLANVDEVSGAKRKENLVNHAEDARVSKRLATVQRDVPVEFDPTAEAAREPDRSRLREVFREFELRDPLRRLEEVFGADGAAPVPDDGPTIKAKLRAGSAADAARLGKAAEPLAVAVRAPALNEGELFAREEAWRFGAASGAQAIAGEVAGPEELVAALGERPVTGHDVKALRSVPPHVAHDTLLAAFLLDPARRAFPLAELVTERGLSAGVDDDAAGEALMIQELAARQREELAERGQEALLDEVELPLIAVLRAMEVAGVRLDVPRLELIRARVAEEIAALEREIWDLCGEEFVIGSPQQLGAILFEKLGLSKKRRGKTGFSTDARVLQSIRGEHEVIPKIERWRELNQLSKTYLDVLPALVDAESRIHTTFIQSGASTGRLASTDPNLQNVPVRTPLGREIRGCFEAAPGNVLISADYSQVELRILAHVADEPVLKEIFIRGEDVHTATAREVFQVAEDEIDAGMRSKSKMINYGIVYGLSDYGLADRLNIPREEAKTFIDAYLARFARVAAFMAETIERAGEEGYVTTLFGRRRNVPELRARNYQVRSLGERLAVNTVIQGTAADVMKLAMIGAQRALGEEGLATRLILSIHDELLFEGPPEESDAVIALAAREMIAPWGDREPPLAVEPGVGTTWLEAK